MTPNTIIKLTPEQHTNMLRYCVQAYQFIGGNGINLRAGLEYRDRVYYREMDWTRAQLQARWANYWGDARKLQNMTVPVVQPQVETIVSYLTEVFCTGEPFFGVVTPPDQVDGALQMETVISDNSRRFRWRNEYVKWFRDGLKYNLMNMEVDWKIKKTFSIINDPTKAEKSAGKAAEEMYAGNSCRRVDLYNAILDTRVAPNELHLKGEYSGYVELMPRTQLKQLIIDLGAGNSQNVREAFESNCATYMVGNNTPGQYYIPLINPAALVNPQLATQMNWLAWAADVDRTGKIEYRGLYEVATIYGRFLPDDFKFDLPSKNTPQIFRMIVVNQRYIIYMERMTNAHNFLPTIVSQPFDDGLGWQAKSFADNVTPYQEMASALWNSGIESKRKLVYDRIYYDPSRINKTDIDNASSVARIPVKAAAYGKPVAEAIHVSPYRDENVVGVLQMAQQVQNMANIANGQNNAQQGQFQKGNKTRFEFETVVNNGNARPRLIAITLEDTAFQPIKEIVKMNIVQYQGPAELYSQPQQKMVTVDPQTLRKSAYTFKLTDGQTPSEKLLNPELMGQVAQLGMAMPAINMQYDIAGMMIYQLKMMGASWLEDFKRTPEQQQEFMAQTAATATAQATPDKRQPAPPPTTTTAQ